MNNTTTNERWISAVQAGSLIVDILYNDLHRPYVNGKCNRIKIEDGIIDGIQAGELPAMTVSDVDFICNCIDDMITMSKI